VCVSSINTDSYIIITIDRHIKKSPYGILQYTVKVKQTAVIQHILPKKGLYQGQHDLSIIGLRAIFTQQFDLILLSMLFALSPDNQLHVSHSLHGTAMQYPSPSAGSLREQHRSMQQ